MQVNNASLSSLQKWIDRFFDFFASVISFVDVVSDILIAYQWAQSEEWTFFWIAIAIFIVAQIAYSTLFVVLFTAHWPSSLGRTMVFCAILPFGQLVPFIIWLKGYDLGWLNALFKALHLKFDSPAEYNQQVDPLKLYIKQKMRTHGGFLVEALVEAVPQSILQMAAIVLGGDAHWINVFSVSISMISVASKGLMFSYSIDRPTFVFNFLCFVGDVFGVFCIVSWIFLTPSEGITLYSMELVPGQPSPWSTLVWLWKEVILVGVIAVAGLWFVLFLIIKELDTPARWRGKPLGKLCKRYVACFLLVMFSSIMFAPCMIAVEGFKLSILPLFVLRSMDSAHSDKPQFYKRIFGFLRGADDFERRLRVTNRYLAKKYLEWFNDRVATYNYYKSIPIYAERRFQAQKILGMTNTQFSLAQVRETSGYTLRGGASTFASGVLETESPYVAPRANNAARPRRTCSESVLFGLRVWIAFVVLPVWFLSAIYSLLMPVICLLVYPWQAVTGLQRMLSFTFLAVVVLLLALSPAVAQFKNMIVHMTLFGQTYRLNATWAEGIITEYQGDINAEKRNALVHAVDGVPKEVCTLITTFLPKLHPYPDPDVERETKKRRSSSCMSIAFAEDLRRALSPPSVGLQPLVLGGQSHSSSDSESEDRFHGGGLLP